MDIPSVGQQQHGRGRGRGAFSRGRTPRGGGRGGGRGQAGPSSFTSPPSISSSFPVPANPFASPPPTNSFASGGVANTPQRSAFGGGGVAPQAGPQRGRGRGRGRGVGRGGAPPNTSNPFGSPPEVVPNVFATQTTPPQTSSAFGAITQTTPHSAFASSGSAFAGGTHQSQQPQQSAFKSDRGSSMRGGKSSRGRGRGAPQAESNPFAAPSVPVTNVFQAPEPTITSAFSSDHTVVTPQKSTVSAFSGFSTPGSNISSAFSVQPNTTNAMATPGHEYTGFSTPARQSKKDAPDSVKRSAFSSALFPGTTPERPPKVARERPPKQQSQQKQPQQLQPAPQQQRQNKRNERRQQKDDKEKYSRHEKPLRRKKQPEPEEDEDADIEEDEDNVKKFNISDLDSLKFTITQSLNEASKIISHDEEQQEEEEEEEEQNVQQFNKEDEEDDFDEEEDQVGHEEEEEQPLAPKPSPMGSSFIESDQPELLSKWEEEEKLMKKIDEMQMHKQIDGPVRGTCKYMCALSQIIMRTQQGDISPFEMRAKDEELYRKRLIKQGQIILPDRRKCIGKYERSAAEKTRPLPHDVRPPEILVKTIHYMCDNIVDQPVPFKQIHEFLRDRCRSIAQDLTYQNIRDETGVKILEIISRFHILSAFKMSNDLDYQKIEAKQNQQMLSNYLKSLTEMYTELRNSGIECDNEPEFTSYYLITKMMSDSATDVASHLKSLPKSVHQAPKTMFGLQVYNSVRNENFVRFFKLLKQADFLTACLMFVYIGNMRELALRVMNISLNVSKNTRKERYSLAELTELLCCENEKETMQLCGKHNLYLEEDSVVFAERGFVANTNKDAMQSSFVAAKQQNAKNGDILRGVVVQKAAKPPAIKVPKAASPIAKPQTPVMRQSTPVSRKESPFQAREPVKLADKSPKPATPVITRIATPVTQKESPFTRRESPVDTVNQSKQADNLFTTGTMFESSHFDFQTQPSFPTFTNEPQPKLDLGQPGIGFIDLPRPESPKPSKQPSPVPVIPEIVVAEPSGPSAEEILMERARKLHTILLRAYFNRWKAYTVHNFEKRKRIHDKYASIIETSLVYPAHIGQSGIVSMDKAIKKSISDLDKEEKQRKLENLLTSPVDLGRLVLPVLVQQNRGHQRLFWKAIVFCENGANALGEWICQKLMHNIQLTKYDAIQVLGQFKVCGHDYANLIDEENVDVSKATLNICVKRWNINQSLTELATKQQMKGCRSIIYVLSGKIQEPNYWERQADRLRPILQSLAKNQSKSRRPMLVVYDPSDINQPVETILRRFYDIIQQLTLLNRVRTIEQVVCVPFNIKHLQSALLEQDIQIVDQQLKNCVTWLVNNSEKQPVIHRHSYLQLVEDLTYSYFHNLLNPYYDQYANEQQNATTTDGLRLTSRSIPAIPFYEFIVHFNHVCDQISNLVTEKISETEQQNWPIPEFVKDEFKYTQQTRELISTVRLPNLDNVSQNTFNSSEPKQLFDTLNSYLAQYMSKLLHLHGDQDDSIIMPYLSNIQNALVNVITRRNELTTAHAITKYAFIFEQILQFHFSNLSSRFTSAFFYSESSGNQIEKQSAERINQRKDLPSLTKPILRELHKEISAQLLSPIPVKQIRREKEPITERKTNSVPTIPNISHISTIENLVAVEQEPSYLRSALFTPSSNMNSTQKRRFAQIERNSMIVDQPLKKVKLDVYDDFWNTLSKEKEERDKFSEYLDMFAEPGSYSMIDDHLVEEASSVLAIPDSMINDVDEFSSFVTHVELESKIY